jgi:hypothetical protein
MQLEVIGASLPDSNLDKAVARLKAGGDQLHFSKHLEQGSLLVFVFIFGVLLYFGHIYKEGD